MLRPGDQVELHVDRLAYGGRGVARHDGLVVFVTGAAAGEVVAARVGRVRRSYAEAEAAAVLVPSVDRVVPRCPHFGPCGGCTWQHIAYPAQAAAKEAFVRESLARLGGIADPAVRPIVPAAEPWFYRNKMDFSFHPDGTLGLHRRGDWNRIEPVEVCYLQSERSAALVRAVRAWARERGLAAFDPRTHDGVLRSLVVREGRGTGERLVGLITSPAAFDAGAEFAAVVRDAAPDATAIVRGIAAGAGDGAPVTRVEVLHGRDHIEELLAGLRFCIGLETFFQTNTPQAERVVAHVADRAAPAGRLVYDLYCGVGTFALALARAGARVAGVELAAASIAAARGNAARNGLSGVRFTAGDVRTALPALVAELGPPDVVVLDPPRAGAGGKVMRKIGRVGAARVIYVSCNPTTLAGDLKELLPFGYRLVDVQPFDLFPQTYHVEAVAVLDREPGEVRR
jgi:23S rRNA (uracil1939-C5)-methyltransferase